MIKNREKEQFYNWKNCIKIQKSFYVKKIRNILKTHIYKNWKKIFQLFIFIYLFNSMLNNNKKLKKIVFFFSTMINYIEI